MKRLFLIPLAIVLVCSLIFGGCAKPAPAPAPAPAPPQPPIKIGVIFPLTGVMAMTGEWMAKGAEFGFEEAGYEVAGRKIEVILEDSGTLPDVAVDKAKKLVEYDKVCMIIGPLVGWTKLAVGAYMSKMGVPHIAPHPNLWKMIEYEWSFMVGGAHSQHSYPMGLYAYDEMGLRTVTVITEDTADGYSVLGAFMDAFKKRGGQVIQEQYAPFPCMDFAPYLAAIKDADAVVAWHHGADAVRFFSQFHEFGIRKRMPLVGAFFGGFVVPHILAGVPPEATDAIVGERCPTLYSLLLETDVNKWFREAFYKKYGHLPDPGHANAYAAAKVAVEALKATGGDTTPEKLRQAMLSVEFEAPESYIRFDPETRFAIKNTYIVELKRAEEYMLLRERYYPYVLAPVYTYKDVPPRGF